MYHRIARTDRYRWWKPLVELVVFVVLVLALWLAAIPALYAAVGLRTTALPVSSSSG